MSNDFEIVAEERKGSGKGANRRLRRNNQVPAVVYGGEKQAQNLVLNHDAVVKHLESEAFYSHILSLKVGRHEEKVVLRDLQRHPSKPRVMHLDLQRVSATEKLRMRIPLHFMGEDVAPGVKQSSGIVSHMMSDVEVLCLAQNLPEFIEVDLSKLEIGDMVHLSDLKTPEGVELVALAHGAEHDQAVASIHMPRAAVEGEAAEEKDEAEQAAGETGAGDEGKS